MKVGADNDRLYMVDGSQKSLYKLGWKMELQVAMQESFHLLTERLQRKRNVEVIYKREKHSNRNFNKFYSFN